MGFSRPAKILTDFNEGRGKLACMSQSDGPTTLEQRFPRRANRWRLRTRCLDFGRRPLLMGIVNVTPDSFSDGGRFLAADAATEHALSLAEQGADLVDIGGESTRPYATPVPADEELRRVLPVLERLSGRVAIPLSIDTSKAAVAQAALDAGAEIVNDVTGLEGDPQMAAVVRDSGAGVCVMHMQGSPQTMQDNPHYADVVREVADYLRARRDALAAAGIATERIALDPGIGFGKTHEHNVQLLAHCHRLHLLGCPLVVGASRKGFIARLLGERERDRTYGTIGVALALAVQGVQVLRVHDVRAVREALLLFDTVGGIDPGAPGGPVPSAPGQ
jgi:dihydropteroate synthase